VWKWRLTDTPFWRSRFHACPISAVPPCPNREVDNRLPMLSNTRMPLDKLPNKIYPALGLSMIDRAFKEAHTERCSSADLRELRVYFGGSRNIVCLYCGNREATRWDHFYPISKGGDTVKGNLVPACSSCDDSKQAKTLDEWALSSGRYRPTNARLQIIKRTINKYASRFNYNEKPFVQKINSSTCAKYKRVRDALTAIRKILIEDGIISR